MDEFLEGFAEERFLGDRLRCDAVAMNIFAIGEATLRLSEEARSDLGNFPWEQIRSVLEAAIRRLLDADPDLPPPRR